MNTHLQKRLTRFLRANACINVSAKVCLFEYTRHCSLTLVHKSFPLWMWFSMFTYSLNMHIVRINATTNVTTHYLRDNTEIVIIISTKVWNFQKYIIVKMLRFSNELHEFDGLDSLKNDRMAFLLMFFFSFWHHTHIPIGNKCQDKQKQLN